ncbi:hypothetical protein G9A89_010956 [Geosiphon pyriformis]|nr:hypothetical protein G9A89_010956 [Geosiphon pyriformis]
MDLVEEVKEAVEAGVEAIKDHSLTYGQATLINFSPFSKAKNWLMPFLSQIPFAQRASNASWPIGVFRKYNNEPPLATAKTSHDIRSQFYKKENIAIFSQNLNQFSQKTHIKDSRLLEALQKMARYANLAYCSENNNLGENHQNLKADIFLDDSNQIIAYFSAPEITLNEYRNNHFTMIQYRTNLRGSHKSFVVKQWMDDVDLIMNKLVLKMETLKEIQSSALMKSRSPSGFYSWHTSVIRFVGHGVGGAYAVLAGLRIQSEIFNDSYATDFNIITFGQPRIGNDAFAGLVNQIFRNKIYRVTHTNDFVPRYPIIDNEGRIFQHHEREYWLYWPTCDCRLNDDTSPAWDPGNQLMYKCEGYEFDGIVLAGENPV